MSNKIAARSGGEMPDRFSTVLFNQGF